jgi:mannitol/fructose-specific phosphotransferase system IIA component (Ntr-type)
MELASFPFEFDFTIDTNSKSRKAALGALAHRIGSLRPGISPHDIRNCLLAREWLGSTAIGSGVAAPCGFRSYPAGHSNLKPATIPG